MSHSISRTEAARHLVSSRSTPWIYRFPSQQQQQLVAFIDLHILSHWNGKMFDSSQLQPLSWCHRGGGGGGGEMKDRSRASRLSGNLIPVEKLNCLLRDRQTWNIQRDSCLTDDVQLKWGRRLCTCSVCTLGIIPSGNIKLLLSGQIFDCKVAGKWSPHRGHKAKHDNCAATRRCFWIKPAAQWLNLFLSSDTELRQFSWCSYIHLKPVRSSVTEPPSTCLAQCSSNDSNFITASHVKIFMVLWQTGNIELHFEFSSTRSLIPVVAVDGHISSALVLTTVSEEIVSWWPLSQGFVLKEESLMFHPMV